MADSNISGFDDADSASLLPTSGKNRFDVLLKSLIARIEFNNTLAPIQEYGRHQKKAAAVINKKKQKKKTPAAAGDPNEQSEAPQSDLGAKIDENYYDLDDDFIDDGDLDNFDHDDEMMDVYNNNGGGDTTSKFQSCAQSEIAPLLDSDGEPVKDADDEDVEESYDPDKELQQKRYRKLLQNFRVLSAEEVEEMLVEDARKEELKRGGDRSAIQPA